MIAGFWGSFEVVSRVGYFKKMAIGWRVLSFVALSQVFKFGIAKFMAPDI